MTKQEAEIITSYLLTKHSIVNSVCLVALNDLKEHTEKHDRKIYQAIRQNIIKCRDEQQALHDLYKTIFPKDNSFWQIYEGVNKAIDEYLLKNN